MFFFSSSLPLSLCPPHPLFTLESLKEVAAKKHTSHPPAKMHYLKNKCTKSQAEYGCLRLLLLISASVGTAICLCPLVCLLPVFRGDSPGRGALRPRPGRRAGLETVSPEAARARACAQGPCGRGDQGAIRKHLGEGIRPGAQWGLACEGPAPCQEGLSFPTSCL